MVQPADFNFGVAATGIGVPHDASFIAFHPDYAAFDPVGGRTALDADVYQGPFGNFLKRAWELLGLDWDGRA